MSTTMPVGAGALLTHRAFLLFLLSRSLSRFSSLIAIVAFGWQVYDLTDSAFALGMMGLAGFLPTALLVFVAGNVADRYERKRILQACQFLEALTALLLAWGAYAGWLNVVDIFIAVLVLGTTGHSKTRRRRRCCRWSCLKARCSAPPPCRVAPRNWRRSLGLRWAASPMRFRPACLTR